MNTHKVTQIFIGNGLAALPTGTIDPASVTSLGFYGEDMVAVNGRTPQDPGAQSVYFFNKLANGDLKKSMEIGALSLTGFKGEHYAAASRHVYSIGFSRATAAGSIAVNNSSLYNFTIRFKNDKTFYSERPEVLNVTFTSSATASQSKIADQVVGAINNSGYGSGPNKQIKAVKVGDGTGAYGLTGAANFGVEIWGLDIPQFTNTTYKQGIVYFSVQVDDSTGFESTTPCAEISSFSYGTGTYAQIFNQENFDLQYEGVLNRRLWPVPVQAYLASNTFFNSSSVVNAAIVTGEDVAVFASDMTGIIHNGEKVSIGGVNYEVKYLLADGVTAILTVPATATNAAAAVLKRMQYNVFNIQFTDIVTSPGAAVGQFANKVILVAVPAINAGQAWNAASAESDSFLNLFNDWIAPLAIAPVTITP